MTSTFTELWSPETRTRRSTRATYFLWRDRRPSDESRPPSAARRRSASSGGFPTCQPAASPASGSKVSLLVSNVARWRMASRFYIREVGFSHLLLLADARLVSALFVLVRQSAVHSREVLACYDHEENSRIVPPRVSDSFSCT